MDVYKKILPKRNITYACLFNMYLVEIHFLSIQLCFQYKWKLLNRSLFTFNDRS